ncbi:MAG: DUF4382 domain-containing protein [Treponema sp.]|nr:DUF4382 domain-containing protein [Treponema sp.]
MLDKNNLNYGDLEDTLDGSTRLVVGMHDTAQYSTARSAGNGKDIQNIQTLNLTVRQMVIIDMDGKHTVILDEDRNFDILGVSRSDPVILSSVSIEPGIYHELRLVLHDENTITVNGEMHPIKIPSGEQSGLKLKGPFIIPNGKLFSLMIGLDTSKSISWNQGQGYRLQPVLEITNTSEIIGIFRGYLSISSDLGANETLVQLFANNSARLRIDDYPNYTLWANYSYNSVRKELRLTNLSLDAPGLGRRELNHVMKKIPSEIVMPVKQWSLDSIIAVDYSGIVCNLYRVDEFNFSNGITFTEFILNIDYSDGSKSGKEVITEVHFIDSGAPPITLFSKFAGSRITEKILVKNNHIQGSSTRMQVISYLFENANDYNTEPGVFGGGFVPFIMSGSYFSETTNNPWQPENHIFTLRRDNDNQEFTVNFTKRMNIYLEHENFSNNYPVVRWDSYPNAHDYAVIVLVNSCYSKQISNDNNNWSIAYKKLTKDTSFMIFSELISFTPIYSGQLIYAPRIQNGDIIRIEVYALDGSGVLNTDNKAGALFMDSINIVR